LEGRSHEINEYSIGVEVYDRPTAFDPRIDSTVRVEAGRLRAKLREYYEAEGRDSAIRIQLPKGSYSPSFREIAPRSDEIEADSDATGRETLKSIAVLPFADLSPAHDQEYFGYGIAEELTFARSRLRQLLVASQTSVFASKETLQDVREICKKLGVEAVLEGSVRKHESKLLVTAQLVSASSGYRVWSEVYDRELEDVFKIQEDISGSVVSALSTGFLSLSKEKVAKAPTGSVEAYEAYLRGRYFWNRQSEESLRMALREFEQAIAEDPGFARAHVGVSDCYRLLEFWGLLSLKDAYAKAKGAAERALELDGSLPEARAALGVLMAVYDWNWAAAERQFHQVFDAFAKSSPGLSLQSKFSVDRSDKQELARSFPAVRISLLKSKVHRAVVTGADLDYEGSLTISADLAELAGLEEYERILVGNLANGERFETYVIYGLRGKGAVELNGATAYLGRPGDRLTIMSFGLYDSAEARTHSPKIVVLGKNNQVLREETR
jgi:L-aspartate-alpha-decarboxylase